MRAVRPDDDSPRRAPRAQPLEPARLWEPAESPAEDPPPLVQIAWHDAWFDPDQQTSEDWRADYLVQTVGFLVRESPRVISVAQELLPDEDGYRAVTHIPTIMIESMAFLQQRKVALPGSEEAKGA